MVDRIGAYYFTPMGVVRTTGFSKGEKGRAEITYVRLAKTTQFRNFYAWGTVLQQDTINWIRLNIEDFPNSADKQLPYVFDLFFDIKRMSQLRKSFQYEDTDELLKLMRNHNIRFERRDKHAKPRRY